MNAFVEWLKSNLTFILGLITITGLFWKPIKAILAKVNQTSDDMSDMMWDRLASGHEELTRRGWATESEKARLCAIHAHYKAAGRNHLADTYEQDILRLPCHPPDAEQ